WNLDSLCTGVLYPRGNSVRYVYERDFNPNTNSIKKGDLRVMRETACCADLSGDGLPDLVTRYEYEPAFGSVPRFMRYARKAKTCEAVTNVRFAAGPRQTLSLNGDVAHDADHNSRIRHVSAPPANDGYAIQTVDPRGAIMSCSY